MSRRTTWVFALLLLSAMPLAAQDKGDLEVSVLATNVGGGYSEGGGSDFKGGVGLGLSYWFSPRWSAELQASTQRTEFGGSLIETHFPDGTILVRRDEIRGSAYPIDLLARYHFLNTTRWKPYVGLGAHYVERPDFRSEAGLPFFGRADLEANEVSAQVNGGTLFMITPRLGLRLDARYLMRGDNPIWDENFKASAGLSFRF
jgi:outer membrane protein W